MGGWGNSEECQIIAQVPSNESRTQSSKTLSAHPAEISNPIMTQSDMADMMTCLLLQLHSYQINSKHPGSAVQKQSVQTSN